MIKRIRRFMVSEKGSTVEWLIGAFILGVGVIPVILSIANAWSGQWEQVENQVKSIIWTGY